MTSTEVARQAGVSQATVTRAFTSPHLVSPDTLERVRETAKLLDYVPNAIARSLKSQRTFMIGAVVSADGHNWQGLITSLAQQLSERDYQLLLFSLEDTADVDKVLATIDQYRPDGLVLASTNIERPQLALLQSSPVKAVAVNEPAASGLIASVAIDHLDGGRKLAKHLLERSVRTSAFVGGRASSGDDQLRYRGAVEEFGAAGVPCSYIEAGESTYDAGYKVAARLLDQPTLPDAIVATSDDVALGLLDGLRRSGVQCPEQVLLTGFDGVPASSWSGYDITTIVQPIDALVREVLDLLLTAGTPSEPAAVERLLEGTLRAGDTTRRL